ncbi:MAG: L,D-transpeptidase family protein [Clostridiaceae bacterium]|nr:L,D-transpeptidase family protein [Clostridiaceae bacterium]
MREYNESKELFIFIDLTKRTLFFFKDGEQIKKYNIAIGTKENPSPIGVFRIIEKGKWGKGFGGRWMGMNVPWGVYGIHGTTKPSSIGRAASHGCIRMRNGDVIELYELVKYGTAVEVYGGPFGPFGKGFRKLYPGDSGADVMEVQRNLKFKGYYKGYLSGCYSVDMERALNAFQKANNLTISNVIDAKMYESLGIVLTE